VKTHVKAIYFESHSASIEMRGLEMYIKGLKQLSSHTLGASLDSNKYVLDRFVQAVP
jgi:hypothetical protein